MFPLKETNNLQVEVRSGPGLSVTDGNSPERSLEGGDGDAVIRERRGGGGHPEHRPAPPLH